MAADLFENVSALALILTVIGSAPMFIYGMWKRGERNRQIRSRITSMERNQILGRLSGIRRTRIGSDLHDSH